MNPSIVSGNRYVRRENAATDGVSPRTRSLPSASSHAPSERRRALRDSILRSGRKSGSTSMYWNPRSDRDGPSTTWAERIPRSPRIQYRFPENCAATFPGRTRRRSISLACRFAAGASTSEQSSDRVDTRAHPTRIGTQARSRLTPPEKIAVSSFERTRRETATSTASIVPTGEISTKMPGTRVR